METFGERLQRLREAKGFGLRRLEDLAGTPMGIVWRLEAKAGTYPSVPTAKRLARVLGVTLDYLCGMDQEWDESNRKAEPISQRGA